MAESATQPCEGAGWARPGADLALTGQQLTGATVAPVQVCDRTEWLDLVRLLRSGRSRGSHRIAELGGLRAVDGLAVVLTAVGSYARTRSGAFMAGTRLAAECRLSPRYVYHLLKVATAVGLLVRLDHGSRKGARYLLACPGGTDGATRIAGAIKTRAARLAGLGKACTYRSTNPRARRVGDSAFVSTQARDMVAHHPWLAHEIARVLDQDAHVPEGAARVVTDILDRAPRRGRVRDPVAYVRAAVRRDPARYRDLWPGAQVDVQATTRVAGMVAAVSQRLRT